MDLVCLSHLRWDFVYQRPQHLMSRFARSTRVFYVEEVVLDAVEPYVEFNDRQGVRVVKLHVPPGLSGGAQDSLVASLLAEVFRTEQIHEYILWYYSPMLLGFTHQLLPGASAVVYDCMDELSHFWMAPAEVREREGELFRWANVVFTGGLSLYDVKRRLHPNVHAFPSSVDVAHFQAARAGLPEPPDQVGLRRPRAGFYGVVDERMDFELLDAVAHLLPDWEFVLVGEVVKIDPAKLPRPGNIHYVGLRSYDSLPAYLASWDAAILPFALNLSTRFISPTKVPEYLAGGKPVVSTSIPDVVRTYSERRLVHIADEPEDFVAALQETGSDGEQWLAAVDAFLATTSWDRTFAGMRQLMDEALAERSSRESDEAAAAGSR